MKLLVSIGISLFISCLGQILFAQNGNGASKLTQTIEEIKRVTSQEDKQFQLRTYLGNILNQTFPIENRKNLLAEIERQFSPLTPLYQTEILRLWAHEVYFFEADTSNIHRVFRQMVEITKKEQNHVQVIEYYRDWGNMLARNQLRLYEDGKKIYEEAYQYAVTHHLHKKMVEVIVGKGSFIDEPSGNINEAMRHYLQAEDIADSLNMSPVKQIDIKHQIGIANYRIKKYEDCRAIFLKLRKLMFDSSIVHRRRINISNTIGLTWHHQKNPNYDSAIYFFELAMQDAIFQKDSVWIGIAQGNIGDVYMEQKMYAKALPFMYKDYLYSVRFKERNNVINTLSHIAYCHKELGNYDSAVYYYQTSLKEIANSTKFNFKENIQYWGATKSVYEGLAQLYEKKQDYKQAFDYSQKLVESKDSLEHYQEKQEVEERMNVALIEKRKAEFDKQEAADRSEIHRQNLILIGGGIFSILLLLLAFVFYKQNNERKKANADLAVKNEEINQQKEEILQQAEELKISNDRLLQLDDFKQTMMATIVHDLKNPLNALLHLAPENQQEQSTLKKVQNHSKMMLNLVMNILDVQKFEDAQMSFDTQEIQVEELINLAQQQIAFLLEEKNIKLQISLNQEFKVKVEKDFITRVLVNLLTNAIKYSPFNSNIYLKITQEGKFVKVSMIDEGVGIPMDKLDKVFQKFVQIDARQSGQIKSTGLGLTFCKMAVEAHGGKIGVHSTYQKGSEFWFTLPITHVGGEIFRKPATSLTTEAVGLLTSEDKVILSPYTNTFKNLEVYYVTELENLLQSINFEQTASLKTWGEQLKNAVFTMNESLYKQLIQEL
jgi:signal transduction histidine kinase